MATAAWHFGNSKSLELLGFLVLLHRSITGFRVDQLRLMKTPGSQAAGRFETGIGTTYFFIAWTMASDFSTCSTGEILSCADDMVAKILPSRPIT